MNTLKRYFTTITASFDHLMSQVENHDALVTGALRDMTQSFGRAQVQLARVEKDGKAMKEREAELERTLRLWTERTLAIKETDKAKALECLKRKLHTEKELSRLREQIAEHQQVETQLRADLRTIQTRIEEIKRKKHAYTARETRTEAMKVGSINQLGIIAEVDDIFERWELRLAECAPVFNPKDPLETEFESKEEQAELEAMLEALQ